jgi:hypothetical protein
MARRLSSVAAGIPLTTALGAPSATAAAKPEVAVVQTLSLGTPLAPAASTTIADASSSGEPAFCSSVGRSELDRADIHDGALVHVVYMLPLGTKDEGLDTDGTLACTVAAQNEWMRSQSGLEWRWDTAVLDTTDPNDPNARVETLDITFVRSTKPAASLDDASEVSTELRLRGLDEPGKRYLTYVASGNDSGICGDAFYPLTHNLEEADGQFAQVYLDSVAGCGARLFGSPATGGGVSDAIAQQELIHNDGMAPLGAPHQCTNPVPFAHICTGPLYVTPSLDPDGVDVMFPYVNLALRDKVLDRGRDDYFRHPLPLADLADSDYLQPKDAWGPPVVVPRGTQPGPSPSSGPDQPRPDDAGGSTRTIDAAVSRTHVRAGARVEISGVVSGGAECAQRQNVELHRRRVGGGTQPSIRSETGSDARFSFRVRVAKSTRFVVAAPPTDDCAAASSAPLVVKVRS